VTFTGYEIKSLLSMWESRGASGDQLEVVSIGEKVCGWRELNGKEFCYEEIEQEGT